MPPKGSKRKQEPLDRDGPKRRVKPKATVAGVEEADLNARRLIDSARRFIAQGRRTIEEIGIHAAL